VNIALWIIAGALAAAFAVGGSTLLVLPRQRYRALADNQHWVDDFGDVQLRAIGTLKVLGAVGLLLPTLLDVAPALVPIAASGMALFMAGAGTTRFRRGEWTYLVGDLVFIALFAFLAWGRFALAPFV
jgi:hypothetical protein